MVRKRIIARARLQGEMWSRVSSARVRRSTRGVQRTRAGRRRLFTAPPVRPPAAREAFTLVTRHAAW